MDTNNNMTKPYMGNLTNQQIGNMAKYGLLDRETVKKMIQSQGKELMNSYNHNQLDN